MRFLVAEKLGPHKFKTPEGYLICTDAILSRTGKQEYKRCELFGDACEDPDKIVNVDRTDAEVFNDKAMASFENKPICIEHPDEDVNAENHNELAVGFVRDIHKGEDNGRPVMMGTLVITDKNAVEAVENGEYKELSCGYDCDINDDDNLQQRNIRGNHVALCKQGRAGIARIVDSVKDVNALTKFKTALRNISKMYSSDPGIEYVTSTLKNLGYEVAVDSIDGWKENKNVPGEHIKQYRMNVMLEGREHHFLVQLYADMGEWKVKEINAYMLDSDNTKQGDSMKDIQATKTPGTDKIIYVMQSDIDKNLYFYIGKTFSMKEGAWGYTKFEMGNTTPEQLKAELSKNGWHAVSQGVARIIDAEHEVVTDEIMKDESRQTLIEKLRTVSVPYGERYALTSGSGWHIDIQHHGQASYENIDKYSHVSPKESSKATIRLWYNGKHMKTFEGPLNSAKSDAIRYLQTRTEDSWSSVEEENYNKANRLIDAKSIASFDLGGEKRGDVGKLDVEIINVSQGWLNISGAYHKDNLWIMYTGRTGFGKINGEKVTLQYHISAAYTRITPHITSRLEGQLNTTLSTWKEDFVKFFSNEYQKMLNDVLRQIPKTSSKDSDEEWTVVEEENYEKANKPIGAKDSKEQLFTVEYKQGDTTYVRKVRANSIEDAISKVKDVYNKFEHETDKEYLKSSINEMSRYIRNWSYMSTREKREISPEGLGALKQMLKFAQQRLAELK